MRKVKILYVEDEPFLAKIVKESLETRNFEVRLITDGAHALGAFEKSKPDICILDIMLPNKDGLSIGREIRSRNPRVPIIFLTAKSQTDDVLNGFEAGGNDYLKKPFSIEELIVRINNLLKLASPLSVLNSADVVMVGKYTFKPNKYELRLGSETRKLSHRETELLKILAENQNYTIERKDILKRVWGDDSIFNSRNLDVYIRKLRSYLDADPNVEIITLKGVGYHFSVSASV